jgi:hypothetical protein
MMMRLAWQPKCSNIYLNALPLSGTLSNGWRNQLHQAGRPQCQPYSNTAGIINNTLMPLDQFLSVPCLREQPVSHAFWQ